MLDRSSVPAPSGKYYIKRHPGFVRITHWVNVICVLFLLMSGLQIFNAHPQLDWGEDTNFERGELLSIGSENLQDGSQIGVTHVFGQRIDTTGILGLSVSNGEAQDVAFPGWATLPSTRYLAAGRRWHFFFAWLFVLNGLAYVGYSILSGHTWRDLVPTTAQLRSIPRSIWDHVWLRFPKGKEAEHYNVLQQLSYLVVIFGLLPLLILAGLTMSPAMNAAFPGLLDLFGGRQSARTFHFLAATALLLFVFVHVAMVLLSGAYNNIRSMITGKYAIESEKSDGE